MNNQLHLGSSLITSRRYTCPEFLCQILEPNTEEARRLREVVEEQEKWSEKRGRVVEGGEENASSSFLSAAEDKAFTSPADCRRHV